MKTISPSQETEDQDSDFKPLTADEARQWREVNPEVSVWRVIAAQALIRRILQRGVDRGEFVVADMDHAMYSVISAMVFLAMAKHSVGACVPAQRPLDPKKYIESQAGIILNGLLARETNKP